MINLQRFSDHKLVVCQDSFEGLGTGNFGFWILDFGFWILEDCFIPHFKIGRPLGRIKP